MQAPHICANGPDTMLLTRCCCIALAPWRKLIGLLPLCWTPAARCASSAAAARAGSWQQHR